jgi:hypothetical protein
MLERRDPRTMMRSTRTRAGSHPTRRMTAVRHRRRRAVSPRSGLCCLLSAHPSSGFRRMLPARLCSAAVCVLPSTFPSMVLGNTSEVYKIQLWRCVLAARSRLRTAAARERVRLDSRLCLCLPGPGPGFSLAGCGVVWPVFCRLTVSWLVCAECGWTSSTNKQTWKQTNKNVCLFGRRAHASTRSRAPTDPLSASAHSSALTDPQTRQRARAR